MKKKHVVIVCVVAMVVVTVLVLMAVHNQKSQRLPVVVYPETTGNSDEYMETLGDGSEPLLVTIEPQENGDEEPPIMEQTAAPIETYFGGTQSEDNHQEGETEVSWDDYYESTVAPTKKPAKTATPKPSPETTASPTPKETATPKATATATTPTPPPKDSDWSASF